MNPVGPYRPLTSMRTKRQRMDAAKSRSLPPAESADHEHLARVEATVSHGDAASVSSERVRLARELHDGLLQSLAGAVLQLEVLCRQAENDRGMLRERLIEIRQLIAAEQRDLRAWIDDALQTQSAPGAPMVDLGARLGKLCSRVSRWSVRATLVTRGLEAIPAQLGDHVYRLVEEALSNVSRHSRARKAHIEVAVSHGVVLLVVEDDGCGFPFRGRYDLTTLDARGLGPASLKERVRSLAGELVVTSSLSGSRIEIRLPFPPQRQALAGAGARTDVDRESA